MEGCLWSTTNPVFAPVVPAPPCATMGIVLAIPGQCRGLGRVERTEEGAFRGGGGQRSMS